ncbi:alpha/beta fold hydrolase [Variovorax saccharolyticus]|uniref:alpha/beta fold hydrolase n=1 Tax=Variovorax saccharolyticus TaxID=3053516 RepID=UPI002574F994|nr:alpha/beta hydrolase [Variovorax sp. J31P216]MDM0028851.1 alpha/beta hydrolase [Variovorax sp. J31P216]
MPKHATVSHATTRYRTVEVEGLNIFYREAGPAQAPTLMLLHGFPSSSRMFDTLIPLLADQYHLIAPDYPGFGHSDAPAATEFAYTFDHLARIVDGFADALNLRGYFLYMQDYGGPIGLRHAQRRPERIRGLIVQNAVAHEEGLGPMWEARRAYWADREAHEASVLSAFTSLEGARIRHVGTSPHPDRYNPDTWTDEFAALSRPGQDQIQSDLFYDYRTNVASYGQWQAWLRDNRPPTLVLWGRHDPSFTVDGARAYARDLPDAEVHLLDAGHFALDEAVDVAATHIRRFLSNASAVAGPIRRD